MALLHENITEKNDKTELKDSGGEEKDTIIEFILKTWD